MEIYVLTMCYYVLIFIQFILLFSFSVPQRYKIKRGKSIAGIIKSWKKRCTLRQTQEHKKVPQFIEFVRLACLLFSLTSGETGLWTFSPQVPYIQGYNNINFSLSNVLVTEMCPVMSFIVFMMSVHTTLLCKDKSKNRQ